MYPKTKLTFTQLENNNKKKTREKEKENPRQQLHDFALKDNLNILMCYLNWKLKKYPQYKSYLNFAF